MPTEFDVADDWGIVSAAKGTSLSMVTFSVAWEAAELIGFGFHSLLGITMFQKNSHQQKKKREDT